MSIVQNIMDATHSSSYIASDQMDVMKFSGYESTNYYNGSHMFESFEVLQSFREDEFLCDIKLKSDDDKIIFGHKIILMSASQYFRAMFTNFSELKKDIINIGNVDSTVLRQLIDYIYTGKIMISKENVQVLLPAANLLQLDYVQGACAKFLQKQLDPFNCLHIRSFADLHNCLELLTISEEYIRKHFLDVVKSEEFLSLPTEELIRFISGNVLNAPEEKVYECVINWVKHELHVRSDSLPKLMEHIRLPLVSIEYISTNVVEEFLFKSIPKSKDYINEAYQFHDLVAHQLTIPQTVRNTPRMSGQKVILAFDKFLIAHWYDPTTNLWQLLSESSFLNFYNYNSKDYCSMAGYIRRSEKKITLIKEHFVVLSEFHNKSNIRILDLSLKFPTWVTLDATLVSRKNCGLGALDDCLYVVGGYGKDGYLNSAEFYDMNNKRWQMIANMSTAKSNSRVGVLNNLLYVVGGNNDNLYNMKTDFKSAECYDPSLNIWTTIAEMSVPRSNFGLGEMDGVLYAVGGLYKTNCLKSVETYKPGSGVWTSIADMHIARCNSSVLAIDGLLYVVGGHNERKYFEHRYRSDCLEIYDPSTNTWSLVKMLESMYHVYDAVVVDKALVTKFRD